MLILTSLFTYYLALILEQFWDCIGTELEQYWDSIGTVLGQYWDWYSCVSRRVFLAISATRTEDIKKSGVTAGYNVV